MLHNFCENEGSKRILERGTLSEESPPEELK